MNRRFFTKSFLGFFTGMLAGRASKAEAAEKTAKKLHPYKQFPGEAPTDLAEEEIKVIQAKRHYLNPVRKYTKDPRPYMGVCTSLLFFTDVHLVPENFQKIKRFYDRYAKYIDDPIHLGDSVGAKVIPPFTMWDLFPRCLNIMGNHDCHYDFPNPKNYLTANEKYDTFFKNYVGGWNVVQPENAEAKGRCYWHKDYNKDLRVVAIDSMALGADQLDWFTKTLADAAEKKLKVVVITHIPPACGDFIPCNFSSIDYTVDRKMYGGSKHAPFAKAIDKFIDGGGVFVSWITGHLHHDVVNFVKDTKHKQLVITIECATNFNWWTDANHELGTSTATAWELISIESVSDVLKITRFGNNFDHYMRHKGTFCYDFKNHRIISQY